MGFQEQVFQLRQRIAILQGQKAAAEEELKILLALLCPVCQGKGSLEQKSEENFLFTTCDICFGTGKASGWR